MNHAQKVDWLRFFLKSTPVPIALVVILLRHALGGVFFEGHWFCLSGALAIIIIAIIDIVRSRNEEYNSGSELYDSHRGLLIGIFYFLPLVIVTTAYITDLLNSYEGDNMTSPISITIEVTEIAE